MKEPIIEGFRLSPQQKHLWLLQQADASQPKRGYCTLLIEGRLNPIILNKALKTVIDRHEILRTQFHCLPGMTIPVQVITDLSLPVVHGQDLSQLADLEQAAKIEALLQNPGQMPFAPSTHLPIHPVLIKLSPEKRLLLISLSSLSADATTCKKLVCEISRAYTAALQGESLADQPVQYADFSEWQHELLEADDTEMGRAYWRKQDLSTLLTQKLPFENHTAAESGFAPHCLTVTLQPGLTGKINAIVQQRGLSTAIFMAACWQVLLWRLTGQSDLTMGYACDGRNYEELEDALGVFAKYVPLQGALQESLPFSEVLEQVRHATQKAYQWQGCFSWDQVIAPADHSEAPFFPFSFDFEVQPLKYVFADVTFSIDQHFTCIDRFKLKLSGVQQDDSLLAEFHYDARFFSVQAIEGLSEQFQTVLESALLNPESAIAELEMVSDRERQRLLLEWNQTQIDFPPIKLFINGLKHKQRTRPALSPSCLRISASPMES